MVIRTSLRLFRRILAWLCVFGGGALLLGPPPPAAAQTPNTSMLDVREHTSEYERYEHPAVLDSISVTTLDAHQRLLAQASDGSSNVKLESEVTRYLRVRNRLRVALQSRRAELDPRRHATDKRLTEKQQQATALRKQLAELAESPTKTKEPAASANQQKRTELEKQLAVLENVMRPLRDSSQLLTLQLAVANLTERLIRCEEQHAPSAKALPEVVRPWYQSRQQTLANLLQNPDQTPPALQQLPFSLDNHADLQTVVDQLSGQLEYKCGDSRAHAAADHDAAATPSAAANAAKDHPDAKPADGTKAEDEEEKETETTLFVKGIGQALFTGTRLVPTPTLKADVVRYSHQRCVALIGSLEVMGLNDDDLKKVDPKAMRVNYLHPEISQLASHLTLGLCSRADIEDVKYKKAFVGLLWRGSYLRRSLPDSTAATQDSTGKSVVPFAPTDHIMSNLTLEFVVPTLNLAFFGGYTYQEAIGNLDKFQQIMRTGFRSQSYFNWGVRGRLNVGKTKGEENRQNVNFEVSFIQINHRLGRFLQSRDALIPVVRVGFTHRFFDNL